MYHVYCEKWRKVAKSGEFVAKSGEKWRICGEKWRKVAKSGEFVAKSVILLHFILTVIN